MKYYNLASFHGKIILLPSNLPQRDGFWGSTVLHLQISIWPEDYHLQKQDAWLGPFGPFWGSQLSIPFTAAMLGEGFTLVTLGGNGSLSSSIYRVLAPSQVVVWDFWTINSITLQKMWWSFVCSLLLGRGSTVNPKNKLILYTAKK